MRNIHFLTYNFIAFIGLLVNGCISTHKLCSCPISSPQMLLKDTIVLQNPKEVEPSRPAHNIWFISMDTTIKNKAYSEWKLLHMDNVYIVSPIISKELYHFLVDSLQMATNSVDYPYRYPFRDMMYCLIFYVRADYYNNHFRIQVDLVHNEPRSQSPIYRPGHKYEYYKMLVEVPSGFYIDNIRKGIIKIPME